MDEIFQVCIGFYTKYKHVCGWMYLKLICLMKKQCIMLLNKLDERSGMGGHVLLFVKKVVKISNLLATTNTTLQCMLNFEKG
jgi:hypothetical protein